MNDSYLFFKNSRHLLPCPGLFKIASHRQESGRPHVPVRCPGGETGGFERALWEVFGSGGEWMNRQKGEIRCTMKKILN